MDGMFVSVVPALLRMRWHRSPRSQALREKDLSELQWFRKDCRVRQHSVPLYALSESSGPEEGNSKVKVGIPTGALHVFQEGAGVNEGEVAMVILILPLGSLQ